MQVITLSTQKGGSGKSTLAINLAVAGHAQGKKVVILDTDPQKTATMWWDQREDQEPAVMAVEGAQLERAIEAAKKAEYELVIIDTQGRDSVVGGGAIRHSDLVLIPCRPTPSDLAALEPTIRAAKQLETPFAFILNQTPPRKERQSEGHQALAPHGPVLKTAIVSRAAFQYSHGFGLGVVEYEPKGKAALEISMLFKQIIQKLSKNSPLSL